MHLHLLLVYHCCLPTNLVLTASFAVRSHGLWILNLTPGPKFWWPDVKRTGGGPKKICCHIQLNATRCLQCHFQARPTQTVKLKWPKRIQLNALAVPKEFRRIPLNATDQSIGGPCHVTFLIRSDQWSKRIRLNELGWNGFSSFTCNSVTLPKIERSGCSCLTLGQRWVGHIYDNNDIIVPQNFKKQATCTR